MKSKFSRFFRDPPAGPFKCETCRDTGEIDQTLGGIGTSDPHCPCPDCVAPVPVYVYVPPKPLPPPCICKVVTKGQRSLRVVNLQCRAHQPASQP